MSDRFLIVGAGFFGSVCARELTDAGHACTVIDQRDHIGGNAFTRFDEASGSHEHVYGAHIFHTNSEPIWRYVNRFAQFNNFVNRVKVQHEGRLYSFPINLLTLHQIWGVITPQQARDKLDAVRHRIESPANLEEWCLSQIGTELYERFVRGYTTKQWQCDPRDLPASLIRRLPVRLNFDDNYFEDRFQGIPVGGYTALFERLLEGIPVELGVDFLSDRDILMNQFDRIIYTGAIDAFFDYCYGPLDYRSLRFEREHIQRSDYQGTAVVNHTEAQVPYTRILEHKHFDMNYGKDVTLITREYPADWAPGQPAFYPHATPRSQERLARYRALAEELGNRVIFGGRLGEYRYYDMHQVIGAALATVRQVLTLP